MSRSSPEYDYLAYIDESGDPGLTKVRPDDPTGSSEWLIVSAVVIRSKYEDAMDDWLAAMRSKFIKFKAMDIHFSKLTHTNKTIACQFLASRPVKIFAVCSNKKNMKGYDNPVASLRSLDKNWFYCWLTRVLLERVTHFVREHSMLENGEPRRVKLVFSNRGGLSYSQLRAYFELLKLQGNVGGLHLDSGQVYFEVIDRDLVEIAPHFERSGLKLPDITASAFFKSCDKYNTNDLNPEYAKELKRRVASIQFQASDEYESYTTFAGYGVKILPSFKGAKLLPEQEKIFRYYGNPRQWWDPTPPTPSPYRLATITGRDTGRHE